MIGRLAAAVASSCIDMLAELTTFQILRRHFVSEGKPPNRRT